MTIDKTRTLIALAWFVIGGVCGFFIGKGIYDQPIEESVTRDTVTITDTIIQYAPKPVSVEKVRTEYKWLPVVRTDTVTRTGYIAYHDTALVEVPITSKHYGGDTYDAWVSGFEPSLDSIKVYRETQYITETITRMKPPNKWELDAMAGIDYNVTSQHYSPYAGGELLYKPNRLQVGIRGGVVKGDNKAEPFAGAVVKIRLF